MDIKCYKNNIRIEIRFLYYPLFTVLDIYTGTYILRKKAQGIMSVYIWGWSRLVIEGPSSQNGLTKDQQEISLSSSKNWVRIKIHIHRKAKLILD